MANLAIHGVKYFLAEVESYHYKIKSALKNQSSNVDLKELTDSVDKFEKQLESYKKWKVSIFVRRKYNALLHKSEERIKQMREMLLCL